MRPDVQIDLFSSSRYLHGHPRDAYDGIRRAAGLYWHDEPGGPGFWAVGRHADVRLVGRSVEAFSSALGGVFMWETDPQTLDTLRQLMILMDRPEHTAYRKLVTPAFKMSSALGYTQSVTELVNELIDDVIDRDEFCLVRDLVGRLPLYFIADVLGIPREDSVQLYGHMRKVAAPPEVVTDADRMAAMVALNDYGLGLREEKLRNPGNDLSTGLASAEVDGETLTAERFAAFFFLLVDAGADTTRGALGAGLLELIQHEDQWAALRADPERLVPTAVEELLRWTSPVVHMRRTATAEIEVGGTTIRPGEKAVMFFGAANGDPEVFDQPEVFDIARDPNPHFAFGGAGPHLCIGAQLARVEMRALLHAVVTRLPRFEQISEAEYDGSTYIIGPEAVQVRQR